MLGVPRALGDAGEEDRPGPGGPDSLHVVRELSEEPRVIQLWLRLRGPGRVPGTLPAIGEDGGDPGSGPALGEPGVPGHAPPVHARPVQRDQQRRCRVPRPAVVPGQASRTAGSPLRRFLPGQARCRRVLPCEKRRYPRPSAGDIGEFVRLRAGVTLLRRSGPPVPPPLPVKARLHALWRSRAAAVPGIRSPAPPTR